MWERFGFYLMLGLLILYMTDSEKGGLAMKVSEASEIYGSYIAMVYFTPFLGGLIADRYLGFRRSVVIGGILFVAGYFLLAVPGKAFFFAALVCLCVGNGFFKPNISSMVGNLYPKGSPLRDAGFNIFYMGINIGAFACNFVAAYVRNKYGWHAAFATAGFGMLIGLSVFGFFYRSLAAADVRRVKEPDEEGLGAIALKILLPAVVAGAVGWYLSRELLPAGSTLAGPTSAFLAGVIPIAVYYGTTVAKAKAEEKAGLLALVPIFLAGATFFMVLHLNGSALNIWADEFTDREPSAITQPLEKDNAKVSYFTNARPELPRPPESSLQVVDPETALMFGTFKMDEKTAAKVASIEGVSMIEAEDGVPVYPDGTVTVERGKDSHGLETISTKLVEGTKPLRSVYFVRGAGGSDPPIRLRLVEQKVFDKVYAGATAERLPLVLDPKAVPPVREPRLEVINPELFQSLNAGYVVSMSAVVVWFWRWLSRRGKEPTTATKIFLGLLLTAASMAIMVGAAMASGDQRLKVSALWLVVMYFVLTVGELFLSPMALSLVTKLSPKRLVGFAMGCWFVSTSFGNKISGFMSAQLGTMEPVTLYMILTAIPLAVALVILMVLPKLRKTLIEYGT
jgi:dipeptide/tripeptide permease